MIDLEGLANIIVEWRERVGELDYEGELLRTGEGHCLIIKDNVGLDKGEFAQLAFEVTGLFVEQGIPAQLLLPEQVAELLTDRTVRVMRESLVETAREVVTEEDGLPPLQVIPIDRAAVELSGLEQGEVGVAVGALVDVARTQDPLVAPYFVLDRYAYELALTYARLDTKVKTFVDGESLLDWGLDSN